MVRSLRFGRILVFISQLAVFLPGPVLAQIPANTSQLAPATKTTVPVKSPLPLPRPNRAVKPPQSPNILLIDGALDTRYRTANTGRSNSIYIQSLELDIQHPIITKSDQNGSIYVQVVGENPPDIFYNRNVSDVALGEAYVEYRLPILTQTGSTAYLKVGQFTLPVGLLPVYDTHLQVVQSLYPLAIGERIDSGIGVEGRFNGVLDYRAALTAGEGSDEPDLTAARVLSFRLGRLFATQYGTFNLGGSLLSGRLPLTRVDPVNLFAYSIPPSGRIQAPYGYEQKTRIIGDGQWTYRATSARGEAMTGADTNNRVIGYFFQGEYRFAPGLSAVAGRSYWDYGRGDSTSGDNFIGLNITYGNNFVIRTMDEEQRDVPDDQLPSPAPPIVNGHLRHIFTVQVLTRF